jgi:LacI family transcriptional regulator
MATKLTIRDIARLAGVSSATVSRVLNEKPDVDPMTRQRIQSIVDEQRFVPSVAGAGLAGGRTGLIGVLVPSLTWAIMSPVLSGVADVIEQTPYELVLYSLGRKQGRGETIHRIVDAKLIDGLIAIYPDGAARQGDVNDEDRSVSAHLSRLYEQGFPVVVIDDQQLHEDMPWISSDNYQGALDAVRHLIALGHQRIAHITGPELYLCSRERLAGYRAALEDARLVPDPELEVPGDFTFFSGRVASAQLFTLPDPPTAIFAANDDMAHGVLAEARQRGLRVPEDVAVVGFDDAESSAYARPPLTTVRQPFFDAGRRAAVTLVALVDAPRQPVGGRSRWSTVGASSGLFGVQPARLASARIPMALQLVERPSTLGTKRSLQHSGTGGEGM